MFGLGMQELLIILFIALILFGGKKLPEIGSNLGKAIRGFRESEEETRQELQKAVDEEKASQKSKEKEDDPADTTMAEAETGEEETDKEA